MSQSIRRVLAATGLVAALLLSIPAPSRAAGLREQAPAAGFVTRAWSWLESLVGTSGPVVSTQRPAMQQKTTIPTTPVQPPANNGSGSMIDPDGARH
jgi:hypothetical protein